MATINFNVDSIVNKTKQNNARNLEIFANELAQDSEYYIPRLTDTMLQSRRIEIESEDKAKIIWDTPYANKQYRGLTKDGKPFNYTKDRNPNAQSEWFHVAKAVKKSWNQLAQKLFGSK